ncbi:MAG: N-acetylgalactosamine 6-sulfate sulfatase (GALNS) [Planctomycetaceae bacterium]|nr:MAG: N-acetylgalactosamine 6-sulfate sulfatase (GALNS) [Planctomycetaceae bacterium]
MAEPSEPDQAQDVIVDLPGNDRVIHVRVHLPNRPVDILAITVETIPAADAPAAPVVPSKLPPQQNADAAPEECAGTAVGANAAVPTRPLNVVLILADDLGWSDTSLMGTSRLHTTPNLRRLAERGMLFTNAYAASPLCSPTRASILTGQNPARIGITAPNCHLPMVRLKPSVRDNSAPNSPTLAVDSATRLDAKRVSLATRLSDAGYATGHFGKWHLGHAPYTPLEHGFDIDIPNHPGPGPAGSFVAPWKFRDFTERTPGEHIEDRMGDEAVAWIERHQDQPFFLNYWQFSVHAPFDAKPELIEAYRSRIDPQDEQRSPTYAAMVHSLDENVGKMLDALDRLGLTDQTAVIFYSDNGGNMYDQVDGTTPTSNRPLRGGKATLYEGGIRVPAIFAWPGVTAPASRSDARIQSTDLYPTVLHLLGLDPTPDHPLDSIDITPALQGEPLDRGPMFTYFPHQVQVPDNLPPAVSVHRDHWKLIRLFHANHEPATTNDEPPPLEPHAYRLYHLKDDIGERHDRSAEHPELVRELDELIDRFLEATAAVVPLPNPRYDPTAPPPPPRTRRPAASAPPASRPAPPRKIGRWNVSGDTSLERVGETLKLISKGGDPWIATTDLPQDLRGPFRVRLRLRSTAAGPAMLYYRTTEHPQFHRDQTVRFDLRHDGTWQDHEIQLPLPDLQALRLDPATAAGEVQIQEFQLIDNNNHPHSLLR